MVKKTVEETYTRRSQHEQILKAPDTYIGSIDNTDYQNYNLYDSELNKVIKKNIKYNPGLYKIFDEILVNAIDQSRRKLDTPVTNIWVTVNKVTGEIIVKNDGTTIPLEIHKDVTKDEKRDVYVPEMIFGMLLTGENYTKNNKTVGGKNGLGAKLANIFSESFTVEIINNGEKYKQTWSNNMYDYGKPKITKNSGKIMTQFTFKPDYKRFEMDTLTDDMFEVIKKRVYDITGCTRLDVNVYFNGKKIPIKGFESYVNIYIGNKNETKRFYESNKDKTWEVVYAWKDDDDGFEQVSFVNGITTLGGGKHVDDIKNQVVKGIKDIIEKKNKIVIKKTHLIHDRLILFVKSTINDPDFKSQTKEEFSTAKAKWGYKLDVSEAIIKKMCNKELMDSITNLVNYKNNITDAKKTDGKKTQKIKDVDKLEDAIKAGTKESHKCTLILTEGLSAKALAISGLKNIGRDYYGIFPLKGKLLNLKTATVSQKINNEEFNNLKKILGLKEGTEYNNLNELRYGKVMCFTDSDHDGYHIKGLIINMFETFWPSLLKINGFLTSLITPIIKVSKASNSHSFYTLTDYNEWKDSNDTKGWKIKYYKGLGTSNAEEAVEYFENKINYKKYIQLSEEDTNHSINLAFNKDKASERKEWLETYNSDDILDLKKIEYTISDFIDKELKHFSQSDIIRSIPNVIDGLKPSQRKILYACFKRNIKDDIKVAQLAGYISEHAAYHHGEMSLHSTMIGMAQNYVSSNNINLLYPSGQFGTRLQNGADAAAPRYIFTRFEDLTQLLFPSADFPLLDYLDDDGILIEPKYYIPIIPMLLVNGSVGIGTGYSTDIPSFNPLDLVKAIKNKLDNKETVELVPFYRKYKGTIKKEEEHFKVRGIWEKIDDNKIKVTEIPVGMSTKNYEKKLNDLTIDKKKPSNKQFIDDWDPESFGHDEDSINLVITINKTKLDKFIKNGQIESKLMLESKKNITNMHAFNKDSQIRKYKDTKSIIDEFYGIRLEYYQKRKDYQIDNLESIISKLNAKIKFIRVFMEDSSIFVNKKIQVWLDYFENNKFPMVDKRTKEEIFKKEKPKMSYDYLTDMKITSLTVEKIKELLKERDNLVNDLTILQNITIKELWNNELDEFVEAYNKWINKVIIVKKKGKENKKLK